MTDHQGIKKDFTTSASVRVEKQLKKARERKFPVVEQPHAAV